jgi:hypothetical protein
MAASCLTNIAVSSAKVVTVVFWRLGVGRVLRHFLEVRLLKFSPRFRLRIPLKASVSSLLLYAWPRVFFLISNKDPGCLTLSNATEQFCILKFLLLSQSQPVYLFHRSVLNTLSLKG